MKKDLQDIRKDYEKYELNENQLLKDPIEFFKHWFKEYESTGALDANAMTLSTINQDGGPSSRIVLLKGIAEKGFEFYTNYNSSKGGEIAANPKACLNFFWPSLERQVRIEGHIQKLSESDSDQYFNSRPRASQIGAWTSPQSTVLKSKEELDARLKEQELRWRGKEIKRPDHWGGYGLIPNMIEFWQGRPSRLHTRYRYTLNNDEWKIELLAP